MLHLRVPASARRPVLLIVLLAATGIAYADAGTSRSGIAQQARNLFATMTNATAPGAHMGQRRGSLDGGSFVARNRIMNEALWNVVPPSFESGCGGIDLFAGSFSFISAEQFQQLLRAIAANAPGYAFQVALENMCPDCMRNLSDLQKKLQALNQGMANSCQLAKGVVNDVASAFNLKHQDQTSLIGMAKGFGDALETRSTINGNSPIDSAADNMTQQQRIDEGLEGNLVWLALRRADVNSWFAYGDKFLLEAIMSITGSVLITAPESAPDGQGKNFRINPLPGGLLSVADLMWGNTKWESGDRLTNGHNKLRKYDCSSDYTSCMSPIVRDHTGPIGIVQLVRNLLLGDPLDASSVGLVEKLSFGNVPISAAEQSFMENTPAAVGAALRTLARHGRGLASNFADQAAPVIAFEMTQVLMNDLLRAAEQAMAINPSAYTKVVVDQIQAAKEQVGRDYQVVSARHGNYQDLIAHYRDLLGQIKGHAMTGVDLR